MAHVIAVAGKGGVGKPPLCGLMIQYLCEKGENPDPRSGRRCKFNLNEVLGVEAEMTLGDVRKRLPRLKTVQSPIPPSMSKADYAEIMFQRCLIEEDDYDMLVMGRTQERDAIVSLMDSFSPSCRN